MSTDDLLIHLRRCSDGEESLDDFEDWFDTASWNAHRHHNDTVVKAVFGIEAVLGDYLQGKLDAISARGHLFAIGTFLQNAVFSLSASLAHASVSSKPLHFDLAYGYSSEPRPILPIPTMSVVAEHSLELSYA
jgi:hypothetical protein